MKKQAFGMVAALFALMLALFTGVCAADTSAAEPDAPTETETAELSAANPAYAILYTDGFMVFQDSYTADASRTVAKTYMVNLKASYTPSSLPWYNERESVRIVLFTDKISPTSTSHWFYECSNLNYIGNIENLYTSNVMNMSNMFYNCERLTALDLSRFDTSNVMFMDGMFYKCSGLSELDVSHFDTSKVQSMKEMFYGCSGLVELDLSHFDTSNVTNMQKMFAGCNLMMNLNLSHFDTSKVTDMVYMFGGCDMLTALDFSSFDTACVVHMSQMFYGCDKLQTIYVSDKFVTSSAEYSEAMFYDCEALVGSSGTKFSTSHMDKEYARIDAPDAPGYFTYKAAPVFYKITAAVMENGKLSVTLTNPNAATLAVSYFDASGKFVSVNLQDAQPNAGTLESPIPANAKAARVMLLDDDFRPLCAARPATL